MRSQISHLTLWITLIGCGTASFHSEEDVTSDLSHEAIMEDKEETSSIDPDSQIKDSIVVEDIPTDTEELPPSVPSADAGVPCPGALALSNPELPPLEIYASISVLDDGGYSLIDVGETDEDQLVIVRSAVNSLTNVRYLLGNPNGVYCIVNHTSVLSTLTIEVNKDAKLFLSAVSVNVLSDIRIKKIEPEGDW